MNKQQENGLRHLVNGTAWMTFGVLGYTIYNLIMFRTTPMKGIWPRVAQFALVAGVLLAIYALVMQFDGLRTVFPEKHETSLSRRTILIAGVATLAVTLFVSLILIKQEFSPGTIMLIVTVVWGTLETAAVQKFYEIGGFMPRQSSKMTSMVIGTTVIGIFCALGYPMAAPGLAYWLLMIPQLIMSIDMLMLNNILITL